MKRSSFWKACHAFRNGLSDAAVVQRASSGLAGLCPPFENFQVFLAKRIRKAFCISREQSDTFQWSLAAGRAVNQSTFYFIDAFTSWTSAKILTLFSRKLPILPYNPIFRHFWSFFVAPFAKIWSKAGPQNWIAVGMQHWIYNSIDFFWRLDN